MLHLAEVWNIRGKTSLRQGVHEEAVGIARGRPRRPKRIKLQMPKKHKKESTGPGDQPAWAGGGWCSLREEGDVRADPQVSGWGTTWVLFAHLQRQRTWGGAIWRRMAHEFRFRYYSIHSFTSTC